MGQRRRRLAAGGSLLAAVLTLTGLALTGCALFGGSASDAAGHARSPRATASAKPTHSATPGAGRPTTSPMDSPVPTTPPPPPPALTPVPTGTVVAEGSVASPKGSIHYRYRVVSDGDNMYSVEFSGFTSTVPVPVSATFLEVAPRVGDGLTFHGIGDHDLGGPTTSAAPPSSAELGTKPSYLTALVTYSSVQSAEGVPLELGPSKVLAVDPVSWSIPARESNVHPVDGGAQTGATGTVTAVTGTGAPARYTVAPGDTTDLVAERFGIPREYLVWLNDGRGVFDAHTQLYSGVTVNLNPDDL